MKWVINFVAGASNSTAPGKINENSTLSTYGIYIVIHSLVAIHGSMIVFALYRSDLGLLVIN